MAALLEKPEDRLKYQLGDLMWNNIVLASENERLARGLEALKQAAGDEKPTKGK